MTMMNLLAFILVAVQVKGWIVTVAGFLIVVFALCILYFIFTWISKCVNFNWRKLFNKNAVDKIPASTTRKGTALDTNDDIIIAIGLALSMSSEVHDNESDEITITRIQRRYSPWSSKIYGLNKLK